MHSFALSVETLRQHVNASTAALAAGQMLDNDATQALAWTIQTLAGRSYAALQAEGCESTNGEEDDNEEGVIVKPLQMQGIITQQLNPILFSHPFVVAPYASGAITEFHLSSTCAVAVFNLALALHAQAFAANGDPDTRQQLLKQVQDFYMQAHDLLNSLDMIPDGTLIQVYLACCNNLAEVYLELNDTEKSALWQTTLCESLWSVPPAKSSPVYRHFCDVCRCYDVHIDE